MPTRLELKQRAKEQIKGKVFILFVCILITIVIEGVIENSGVRLGASAADGTFVWSMPASVASVISFVLSAIFALSLANIFLKVSGGERPDVGEVFSGFGAWGKAVALQLLIAVFTTLWMLLFVIPGFIKMISYCMSFYILADNPDMTAREALAESKRITKGHKVEIFVFGLSFLPWFLLMGATFGLAGIYVLPYVNAATANLYRELNRVA